MLGSLDEAIVLRLQSESENPSEFNWNITDFNPNSMDIQLNFTDAGSVSLEALDVLIIQIMDPFFFKD